MIWDNIIKVYGSRAEVDCPKVTRLPWEIKSENVHIDTNFLLGEGTISNVYLGKNILYLCFQINEV